MSNEGLVARILESVSVASLESTSKKSPRASLNFAFVIVSENDSFDKRCMRLEITTPWATERDNRNVSASTRLDATEESSRLWLTR